MNTQLFQLVFLGCTCLLSCQGLAATRPPNYRDRGQLLIPRQTVSGSSPPTFTVYTTVSASDPFQTQATSTQTTFSSSTITRSPTSTTIITVTVTVTYVGPFLQNSGCSLASQEIVYCTSLSPGFLTMPYASKTSCLCSFGGEPFNSAVSICAQYASTADIGLYRELASWEGFCSTLASSSPPTSTQPPGSSPTSTPTSTTTPTSSNRIAALTTPQRAGIISGCTIFGVGLGGLAAYAACFKGKRTPTGTEKEKKKNDITSGVVAPAASPLMQKSEFPSPEISEEHHPLPKRVTV